MPSHIDFTDDVLGEIIGESLFQGWLFYNGRMQGRAIYAHSQADVENIAKQRLSDKKEELGFLFKEIYTLNMWEIRII